MTIATTIPRPPRPPRRWSGEDLDRMIDAGIVREGSGAYLWDGEVIEPLAEDQPHYLTVKTLRKLLEARLPEADWSVNPGQPVDLAEGFRPQPDVVILRGPDSAFAGRGNRPGPGDVALLIEVADRTYADDSGAYLRAYARAGIPQYWIVNLRARRVEVYGDPEATGARSLASQLVESGGVVPLILEVDGRPAEFDGLPVAEVLRDTQAGRP